MLDVMKNRVAKIVAAAALACALIVPAVASMRPSEISGTIRAERPLGQGSLSFLFITAYDATLWTDAPQWSMNAPFALTFTYGMSFSSEEIAERTVEEMKRTAPRLTAAERKAHEKMLLGVFPPVRAGDRITALHVPGKPVRFFHNGRPTGDSISADFAEPFFGIWLAENTPEPTLRKRLLGQRR